MGLKKIMKDIAIGAGITACFISLGPVGYGIALGLAKYQDGRVTKRTYDGAQARYTAANLDTFEYKIDTKSNECTLDKCKWANPPVSMTDKGCDGVVERLSRNIGWIRYERIADNEEMFQQIDKYYQETLRKYGLDKKAKELLQESNPSIEQTVKEILK